MTEVKGVGRRFEKQEKILGAKGGS